MDDGYRRCVYCGFVAKMRKDGTMRKHREARDAGYIGSTGSLPQDPHAPICKGTGELTSTWVTNADGFLEEKWGVVDPEPCGTKMIRLSGKATYCVLPKGHDKAHSSEVRDDEPTMEEYAVASRIIQSLMPGKRH